MTDTITHTTIHTSAATDAQPALAGGPMHPTMTAADGGRHLHFLNHLATVKSPHDRTVSGMNAVEFTAPRGFGPPLHRHSEEDEIMYVVEGDVRLLIDGQERTAGAGAVIALPAQVPHTFQVISEWATFLTVAGGQREAAPFDVFVAELGEPTATASQPVPVDVDPGHVAAVAAAHGIEILGPPPAPLD